MPMENLADQLSRFARSQDAIPTETLHMMRLSLLDWVSCGIAGAREPVAQITRQMVLSEGGTGQVALFGGGAAPARSAALVNGTTSHALDYDDTHFAHIGHASVAVIPAALGAAMLTGASGAAFLDAATRGIEASIRVGEWLGRAHYQIGFHQTGTAGSFGAAIAAGRLLGLSAAQMSHALGLTATKAAALKSQFGTMGKPYNAGLAASCGIEVALLAQAGFVSNPDALDGAQGFGPTHHGEANTHGLDALGQDWRFDTISHKFHACCHGTHAMIEALLSLRDPLDPRALETLEIRTHPRWLSVCDLPTPETGLEAKFSYRLIAAMVLSGHDTSALSSFSDATAHDPALNALRDKITVIGDESLSEMQAQLHLCAQGIDQTARFDLDAPIELADRERKLKAKSQALIGDAMAQSLANVTLAERAPDLDALSELIAAQ